MNTLDAFGTEYLRISFGMERHFPGFIDAYVGPQELRAEADMAPPPASPICCSAPARCMSSFRRRDYPDTRRDTR